MREEAVEGYDAGHNIIDTSKNLLIHISSLPTPLFSKNDEQPLSTENLEQERKDQVNEIVNLDLQSKKSSKAEKREKKGIVSKLINKKKGKPKPLPIRREKAGNETEAMWDSTTRKTTYQEDEPLNKEQIQEGIVNGQKAILAILESTETELELFNIDKSPLGFIIFERLIKLNSNLANVTSLDLKCNKLENQWIKVIANSNFFNLTSLDLSANNIGDEGAQALANGNFFNLKDLRLISNNI
jgi:hypothetical protein